MAADPWALLREARERADSVDGLGDDLERRIDAALAERQDSATDVVEWESGDNYEWTGRRWCAATIGDRVINIHALDKAATRFYWRVFSTLDLEGNAATEAEAKSAAIAAARGMR